ncbi:sugar MFS transporter [Belliella marina]|uniref:Sugar MFS transporter n=1 Tax=Belliella marina TaxID=1644146 RepID=A0ABW4VSP6_9BACT
MAIIPLQHSKDNSIPSVAGHSNSGPLFLVTLLFFMWGIITCMNDILIPHLQQVFTLQHWQAMLVQTAFFGAYFFISLLYYIISVKHGDPISEIGYKKGIILGLIVAGIGCLLFYPAASLVSYTFFLFALFILASGITLLQIAANPYVTILGKPEGASSRLNMTQAFNSLGTTIAPVLGGYLIFEGVSGTGLAVDLVKLPYLGLALTLFILAFVCWFARLPEVASSQKVLQQKGAMKFGQLRSGIVAIFAYVGAEVAIGSNLINFAQQDNIAGLDEASASHYLALFWGGAMIGRFFGAIALGSFRSNWQRLVLILASGVVALLVLWAIYGIGIAGYGSLIIATNIGVILLGKFIPQRTLWLFATATILLLLSTVFLQGQIALWSVVAIGIFNSIMFPTIFSLAVKGLGDYTAQGSSLLVMAIVGGAIITPIQGLFADLFGSVQLGFLVPLICYIYVVYFGITGYKPSLNKKI